MKKSYVFSLIIIIVLFLTVILVTCDYSKFKKKDTVINEGAIVLSEGNLSINFSSGKNFYVKNISDGYSMEKKFSVTNMGDTTLYYTITLNDIDNRINSTGTLMYNISSTNGGAIVDDQKFPKDATEVTGLVKISPGVTQSYKLALKYSGAATEEDYITGSISVKIKDSDKQTFSDVILMNNNIKKATTKPGKEIATTDEGLILSTDDDGTTYYFRGNVTNNYVKFSDKMWRIVRINGNNTVKLILDDVVESGVAFNSSILGDGRTDYYTLVNPKEATIKKQLDNWFTNNVGSNAKFVADTKFCSDINISKETDSLQYFSSYVRVNNNESPLFNCIGTVYNANVGLLTVDEAIYAGAFKDSENKESYLYKESIEREWWLQSPYTVSGDNTVRVFTFKPATGTISTGASVTDLKSMRPVISIKDNASVSGSGTLDDPYVIQ